MDVSIMQRAAMAGLTAGVVLAGGACSRASEGIAPGPGRPPVAVEVAAVAPGEIVDVVEVVGSLAPKFSTDVRSEFTAVVAQVYVTEWVPVRRGEPLARLDTAEGEALVAAARAAVLEAKVRDAQAARELARAERLREVGLLTAQGLDDARTAREAAAAGVAAAEAQLALAQTRLDKAVIRAPFDGVVARRWVSPGDLVENMGSPRPLFTIVDPTVLELTATVPSSYLPRLAVGQTVEFTTDAVPGRTVTGTVSHINPLVDTASRSVQVITEVPNPEGRLRGGMFVKGRVLGPSRRGLLLPRAALRNWDATGGAAQVWVVAEGVVQARPIRTGQVQGEAVEVVEGLEAGDEVITRGAFNVQPGDPVTVAARLAPPAP